MKENQCFTRRRALKATGATSGLIFGGLLATNPVAGQISISSCTTIESSGDYVLTQDIDHQTGRCIIIDADDVTIDGQGHTISGATSENPTQRGLLYTDGVSNLTIKNITVRDWVEGWGLHLRNVTNLEVTNITALNCTVGATIRRGTEITLTDNTVSNCNGGIALAYPETGTVRNNSITENAAGGMSAYGFQDSEFVGNTIADNGSQGLYCDFFSDNKVRNNTLSRNGRDGLGLKRSDNNLISNNTILDNEHDGIDLLYDSSGNRIVGNNVCGNGEQQINENDLENLIRGNSANC